MSVLGLEGRHWGAGTRMGHTLRNGMKGSQKRWAAGRTGEQEQPAWQTGRRGWWEGGKMGGGGGRTVVARRVEVATLLEDNLPYKLPSKKPRLNGSAQVLEIIKSKSKPAKLARLAAAWLE